MSIWKAPPFTPPLVCRVSILSGQNGSQGQNILRRIKFLLSYHGRERPKTRLTQALERKGANAATSTTATTTTWWQEVEINFLQVPGVSISLLSNLFSILSRLFWNYFHPSITSEQITLFLWVSAFLWLLSSSSSSSTENAGLYYLLDMFMSSKIINILESICLNFCNLVII